MAQPQISSYETDARQPTWPVMCRLLAAMGMQPRVVAEPVDISHHPATAAVRQVERPSAPPRADPLALADLMRPDASVQAPNLRGLMPIVETLDGSPYVIVGAAALRLHGLGCVVPYVEAVISVTGTADRAAVFARLSERIRSTHLRLWSPDGACYRQLPSACEIAGVAAISGDWLHLRTRETATEVRIRVTAEPSPAQVTRRIGDLQCCILALSELTAGAGPAFAELLARLGERTAAHATRWTPQRK